ncbi:MAG: hypothetical protein MI861_14300 [Pirellulales bacterium]|nr:hypothetical protein [Pirellulales bacterium]
MKLDSKNLWLATVGLLAAMTITSLAVGQSRPADEGAKSTQEPADAIPEAALLTERGQQLAERLKYLRTAESNMGAKHPSRKKIQDEIKKVKEELSAWAPLQDSSSAEGQKSVAQALPAMNDRDLRQLILRMSGRIEQLEQRVEKLERRMQIF